MSDGLIETSAQTTPLVGVDEASWAGWLAQQPAATANWLRANDFAPKPGRWLGVPGADGALQQIIAALGDPRSPWSYAHLPRALPPGDYALAPGPLAIDADALALGFALGSYRYSRYRQPPGACARLLAPAGVALAGVRADASALALARDLTNTPAEDLGPAELAQAAAALAERHGGRVQQWIGDELLEANFPSIHAVGRASTRAPRLIELRFGEPNWPRLTVVGKGVCFDTGGLDLKPADGMRWMKKDMGGAALALGLAQRVLEGALPVQLTVLIAAVENSVSGNSMRPGDVLRTRAGLSVEIDNTDAEGRLVLADALSYAAESRPELLLDFATLTGAARIALGPDLPALFCNDEALAAELLVAGERSFDPLWRLPLWRPYRSMLDSHVADLANASPSKHAGAIIGALYLERFVPEGQAWAHLDTYCWNDADRPGRPRGGEAQGLRAYWHAMQSRFAQA